ncbi:MAG: aldo/keto reductase [Holophaga sp.]|nr:aldo/keto reductase [Holophaga sp.]
MSRSDIGRRELFRWGAAAAAGLVAARLDGNEPYLPSATREIPRNPKTAQAMPTRNLGRTDHLVGIFSLGAQASIEKPNNEKIALPLIERALDLGVNYIDTSARYGGDGRWSERYLGQVMKKRRNEVFLASKTHDRTRDGSLRHLDISLMLLVTDRLDLWQLLIMQMMEYFDKVCAKGGALEAFLKARDQGLVRYLGITGHADPDVLMEGIRRFPFDTVLMAFNAADPQHRSFRKLLSYAVGKEMGIIGMKVPARSRLLTTFTPPPNTSASSPKLVPGTLTMQEAMRYVLSFPFSTVIIGCDTIAQLEANVGIARNFRPFNQDQLAAIEAKAKPVAEQSLTFRKK